jgi:hypothetical protein
MDLRRFWRRRVLAGCLGLCIASWASAASADGASGAAAQLAATRVGAAAWRAESFDGRITATGERFDMYRLTAASAELPLNSYAAVTNLATGDTVVVRINDRPAAGASPLITLSFAAAHRLGVDVAGAPRVKVTSVAAPAGGVAAAALLAVAPRLGWAAGRGQVRLTRAAAFGEECSGGVRDLFRRREAAHDLLVTWADDAPSPLAGL